MSNNIISSFKVFSEKYSISKEEPTKNQRAEALKKYFERGGVVSVKKKSEGWPRLIYPSPLRIRNQIKELQTLKGKYLRMQRDWEKELSGAKAYHLRNNILKLSEPLYWKHLAKATTDKDYRQDAEQVKLPAHLVSDPRWKPMIKMFVNDIEYRKQLVETVQNSIVYRKDRRVAKYANILQSFKVDLSGRKIEILSKKIESINDEISALEAIFAWAKES